MTKIIHPDGRLLRGQSDRFDFCYPRADVERLMDDPTQKLSIDGAYFAPTRHEYVEAEYKAVAWYRDQGSVDVLFSIW